VYSKFAMLQVLAEAFIVGIILLLVSTPIMVYAHSADYPAPQKYYIATFATGMLVHLLCEASGLNKMYCSSGAACKR
jgi:hypothetical protein